MDKKLSYFLAANFLMRAKYYDERKEYGVAVTYESAFVMIAHAINGSYDCLRQFGWSDEAEELIDKIGTDIDPWDLENLIR